MKLNDRYDGSTDPFQGDRVLRLRRIPARARIRSATATITPAGSFTEIIALPPSPPTSKDWGATEATGQGPGNIRWVEVDFHARRTLARVEGTNINTTTLQVDFGGVYVEINDVGGIRTPNGNNTVFTIGGSPADLPGLTVTKFKLTRSTAVTPDISNVTIRSVPTNLTLRFGETPTFWTRVGEMTLPETTPDFALALQAFLTDAEPENGFYDVPLIVHTDSIARLQIDLEVEFVVEESALDGLNSVALPFDFSRAPNAETKALELALPMNSRLSPRASRARIQGAFAETRIAYDPMEKVTTQAGTPIGSVQSVAPADKVPIAPGMTQAQPVSFDNEISAVAIDLLLEVKETARMQLDLREDLDGKPGRVSLLPIPVDFEVPGPVGLEDVARAAVSPGWRSVALPAEFKFKASDPQTPRRYWIIVQSLENQALWSVEAAKDAPNLKEAIGMQRSTEDGLAWRETAAPQVAGALTAFFRLRRRPDRFEMPIALQIGQGDEAVRVSLDRFAPSGAVDLALNFDDVNRGVEEHLKKRAPICNEVEHLLNGDFEQWVGDAAALATGASQSPVNLQPLEWNLTAGSVARYHHPGQQPGDHLALLGLRVRFETAFENVESALSQVTPVVASCTYAFSFHAIASDTDAFAEIFWRGETCESVAPEPVRIPIQVTTDDQDVLIAGPSITFSSALRAFVGGNLPLPLHRELVTAPAGAEQAEIRFSVPDGVIAAIDNVSLMSTAETLVNGDFRQRDQNRITNEIRFTNWTSLSGSPTFTPTNGAIKFDNSNTSTPFEIAQTMAVKPDQPFTLSVLKRETKPSAQGALPRVELRWLKDGGGETGDPIALELDRASFGALLASGISPRDATQAEIHLIVPPGASQEIESISLSFPTRTLISVTFVAQAPGELTIADWQIGYEEAPVARPPIPPRGLCAPTPPGRLPGETSADHCLCKCSDSQQPMVDAVDMRTANNAPAMVGRCANCGEEMISFGGRYVPGARRLLARAMPPPQPMIIAAEPARTAPEPAPEPTDGSDRPPEPQPERIELPPITAVKGIGERLALQLASLGIDSLEDLAEATPELIAEVKGISEAQAARFIAKARKLIRSHHSIN